MQHHHKMTVRIGLAIIFLMGSMLAYGIINYDSIREDQYHRSLQQMNAK